MFRPTRRPSSGSTSASYRKLIYSIELRGYMLRSHHLRLYNNTQRKTYGVRSCEVSGKECAGAKIQITLWGHHIIITDNKLVVFLTSLHYTFMLHT